MTGRIERTLVRGLIGAALGVAVLVAAFAPSSTLPAIALGQPWLYRLEVSLLAFYGCLLLITPAFSGLIRGRLPIEISTRGARFAEEADHSDEASKASIKNLERSVNRLTDRVTAAEIDLGQLQKDVTTGDRQ
jgi:hypothetical protein